MCARAQLVLRAECSPSLFQNCSKRVATHYRRGCQMSLPKRLIPCCRSLLKHPRGSPWHRMETTFLRPAEVLLVVSAFPKPCSLRRIPDSSSLCTSEYPALVHLLSSVLKPVLWESPCVPGTMRQGGVAALCGQRWMGQLGFGRNRAVCLELCA